MTHMFRPIALVLLLSAFAAAGDKLIYIPLPHRERVFVPPETVGVPKDCPFPTVKEKIEFKCPKCRLRGWTHVLYPHLPHCPRCRCPMNEVVPDPRSNPVKMEKMG
jgi:hypothetical protein